MNKDQNISPPNIPLRFLRWFCNPDYIEDVEGDLTELFISRSQSNRYSANLLFWADVMLLLRPGIVKNFQIFKGQNQFIMFKNYYKTSFRAMIKNPLSSFINLFGLSAAIGICVFAYGFAQWTYRTDQFHENKKEVYLLTFFADREGSLLQNGQSPRPLGLQLQQDFAHVRNVCRIEDKNVVMKLDDKVFHETVRLVDSDFLQMLTFPLKWGSSSSLSDVNSIILSEPMSEKYFGEENPVGQNILLKYDKDNGKTFKVTGVANEFPKSRSFDFDFLINYQNSRIIDPQYDFNDWNEFVSATMIQVDRDVDLTAINSGLEKYTQIVNNVQSDWQVSNFHLEQLAALHEVSSDIRNCISSGSKDNYTSIIFLAVIAGFLLTLACFNYINIAIVSAAKRLKEIGIRKSIGATRRTVIFQFLIENIFMTFFAMIIGLILGVMVIIPWFEQMNYFDMDFRLYDPKLWVYLPIIMIVTGIASGIYPAFYISKYQVTGILRGNLKFGKRNPLTKLFLGIQLILSCILITSAVMFTQNNAYNAKRSWGYNQSQALYTPLNDPSDFKMLKSALEQNPNVLSIAGASHHLGKSHATKMIDMPDRQYEVHKMSVDADYFATLGLQIKSGRGFQDHQESDKQTLVVNESFVSSLDLDEPLAQVLKIDSIRFEIIGVVQDFHSYSFDDIIKPTIFTLTGEEEVNYLALQVRKGSEIESYLYLQDQWARFFPEIPFQGGYQEDVWGNYFEVISVHGRFWRGIAYIAVIMAALGLYGLVTLNVSGRIKEFSIRKVLGARVMHISRIILKNYFLLFSIALIIGVVLSYLLVDFVLDFAYVYHVPMNISGVVIASILLLFVLIAVVTIQVTRLSKSNPVNGLRME